jgi:hypothetical protein
VESEDYGEPFAVLKDWDWNTSTHVVDLTKQAVALDSASAATTDSDTVGHSTL